MTLDIELSEGGWFDGLPPSQRSLIDDMLASLGGEEAVAKVWLNRPGSSTTAGFGGEPIVKSTAFYEAVKGEFVKFVCGDNHYDSERKQVTDVWNKAGKPGLVSLAAVSISHNLGYAVVAVLPVISLMFSLASKVTINAFCVANGKS